MVLWFFGSLVLWFLSSLNAHAIISSMETIIFILKYGFLIALTIEAVLVGRALVGMVREKARAAEAPPPQE